MKLDVDYYYKTIRHLTDLKDEIHARARHLVEKKYDWALTEFSSQLEDFQISAGSFGGFIHKDQHLTIARNSFSTKYEFGYLGVQYSHNQYISNSRTIKISDNPNKISVSISRGGDRLWLGDTTTITRKAHNIVRIYWKPSTKDFYITCVENYKLHNNDDISYYHREDDKVISNDYYLNDVCITKWLDKKGYSMPLSDKEQYEMELKFR